VASFCFLFKFVGCPVASTSSFHTGHGPDNLSQVVFECFRTEANISLAGGQKGLSGSSVSAEFGREGRVKGKLLSASRRGSYRWHRGSADGMCWKRILHVLGLCGAKSSENILQEPVGGFVLTFHLIHGGLDGEDVVHVDRLVIDHIRG